MASDIGFALLLSALAGLSTTIGSLLGLFVRQPGPCFMTLTLVNVWSLFHLHPKRLRYQRYLSWLPLFRNAVLFIEARL